LTPGGTDSIALSGLTFGIVVMIVFLLIFFACLVPFRLMHRFMEWARGDD